MPYDADLAQYAKERDLEIKYTEYFSQDKSIPGIGGDEKLRQVIFSMEKGETSEVIEVKGKFYIFQVADRVASYLPEMTEVEDKLKDDFIAHLGAKEAKATAENYLAALKEANLINKSILRVKVMVSGKLEKAVTLKGIRVTKGAREAIEAAGGKVEE